MRTKAADGEFPDVRDRLLDGEAKQEDPKYFVDNEKISWHRATAGESKRSGTI